MVMLHYRWCNMIVCREERCTHAEATNGFPLCVTSPVCIAQFDWCAASNAALEYRNSRELEVAIGRTYGVEQRDKVCLQDYVKYKIENPMGVRHEEYVW